MIAELQFLLELKNGIDEMNINEKVLRHETSQLLTSTQLAEESNALNRLPIRTYRVSVSCRTVQCRVRHFTPTYDMTKELKKNNLFF